MRSGLGSDQVLAVARVFTALFLSSDGSLPKFPFSGIGRGRNYEMKIRTAIPVSGFQRRFAEAIAQTGPIRSHSPVLRFAKRSLALIPHTI
jgi:hypothetical protein